jgi:hypothetical protein
MLLLSGLSHQTIILFQTMNNNIRDVDCPWVSQGGDTGERVATLLYNEQKLLFIVYYIDTPQVWPTGRHAQKRILFFKL